MIKHFVLIIFILFTLKLESQNWDSIRGGYANDQVEGIIYDSVHNELIISGKFINKIGNLSARGIARWNGSQWDTLGGGINTHSKITSPNTPAGMALCGIPYNGKLLVGGCFNSIGGINAVSLALWDGVKWDSLPKRAFNPSSFAQCVNGLYRKGNLVYIVGTFTSIGGQSTQGLGIWDGTNFSSASTFTFNGSGGISDIIEFQNELYVSGGYFYNPPTYISSSDILKFDGTKWISIVPGGIKGFNAGAATMAVYNSELYIGGHFLFSDGNPGENIMKWNGNEWQDVGFGGESVGLVRKLIVKNNKLWAFGCFYKAAYMPAFSIAVYDGTKWCALQDTLDNCILAADVYKDTIYVGGGFWSAGGDIHIANLAKLKNEMLYKSCNGVGISELDENSSVNIYPNPVTSTLHIDSEQYFEQWTEIEIINTLGQTILKSTYSNDIDVSTLSQGYYILKIISPDKRQFHSKFLKE